MVEEARRANALPPDYQPDRFTVVGVADDVLYGGLRTRPCRWRAAAQDPGDDEHVLVVRTGRDPGR